jgi:hypothetical protein
MPKKKTNYIWLVKNCILLSYLTYLEEKLKSQEDKLKDEFILLRGSLLAGNNNPDLLRKFKIVQLKMKNNKLISLQEYNEVLNILLELKIFKKV